MMRTSSVYQRQKLYNIESVSREILFINKNFNTTTIPNTNELNYLFIIKKKKYEKKNIALA